MKRYQITIDGHSFEVQLLSDPHQDRVKIEVDGQPLLVEVRDLDLDGREEGPEDRATVPGATAVTPAATAAAQGPPPSSAPSGLAVAAPLPGVVKSIAVRPGQHVGPGDKLLVIEAMKMDNVIRASRQGVVDAIHVAEGHRVAHGDVMIEYEE
jgi:biotin carboxyl carrier protein